MTQSTASFDWAALKQFITTVEHATDQQSKLALSLRDRRRYVLLQRCIMRNSFVAEPLKSRDAMIELASEFQLSRSQAKSLYARLQQEASNFALGKTMESLARAGSFIKPLEEIRKSLQMVADFSAAVLAAGAKEQIIETHLENAAHFWAKDLYDASKGPENYSVWETEAKPHGFSAHSDFSLGYEVQSFNSLIVVRTWLRNNVLFSKLISNIIEKHYKTQTAPERSTQVTHDQDDSPVLTESVRLAGITLPRLYTEFTGRRFGFSQSKENILVFSGGPKFVSMCFPVMGLASPSLSTLRAQYRAANLR